MQRLSQSLRLSQSQRLSPQQIQFIKLLQVPTAQLEQRVQEELEENPALEEGLPDYEPSKSDERQESNDTKDSSDAQDNEPKESETSDGDANDLDLSEYLWDDDVPDYRTAGDAYSADDEERDRSPAVAIGSTFYDQLTEQLGQLTLTDSQAVIAKQLIGSLDTDGYLRRPVARIVDDLAFTQGLETEEEEVEAVLKQIQRFDPAGIGARDLQECLLLQLKRRSGPAARHAEQVIAKGFDEYAKRKFEKLRNQLNLTEAELRAADAEIHHCNPRPGGTTADGDKTHQIIPDYHIGEGDDGELELKLNSRNAPDLRVSGQYREMLKEYQTHKDPKQKEAVTFVKQKLDAAKWFIDAVRQRQNTLLVTMEAILDYQREFFRTGDETRLRPMILKDIAERVGLDISTISRVANSKYVQTEYGTFPLKFFFSEGIMTDSGEEASSKEVKSILADAIAGEDKSDPLPDEKLMEILKAKGYNIARRTVAKYREQLKIPVARMRKAM